MMLDNMIIRFCTNLWRSCRLMCQRQRLHAPVCFEGAPVAVLTHLVL